MNLRTELCPDMATAEKLYPLILERLQDYETFWEAQPDNTPEAVFDAEYKAMETYLSELTGKDLSKTWLWEWWEDEGIEVFAFRLALPEPKKVSDFSKNDVLKVVQILKIELFEEDFNNRGNGDFYALFTIYLDDYYHNLLKVNFPKTYDFKYFIAQKDGGHLCAEQITDKIFKG